MAKAVGIDLGTTNSVIATVEGGHPTVIPNAEGQRTTPSVVGFTDQGDRLVGQLARRQAVLNPKGTIYSAKRFIGRRYEEVESELNTVTFDVVAGPDGAVRFDDVGELFEPSRHEAVSTVESDAPPNTIVATVRPGYGNGEEVLRPAAVIVSRSSGSPSAPTADPERSHDAGSLPREPA